MKIINSEFQDPDDFEIKPRTETSSRRSLSGKVYGSRRELREELVLTFEAMTHPKAAALKLMLYELTTSDVFDLFFKRASSSDILDCTNAFKGTVEYVSSSVSTTVDPKFSRGITHTFHIHTYETF